MKEIVIILILAVVAFFVYLAIKGLKIEDKNNNNIPDVVEDKFNKVKEEVVSRAKEVSKELSDVKEAVKEVGRQASQVPGAVAGKKRPGRKK